MARGGISRSRVLVSRCVRDGGKSSTGVSEVRILLGKNFQRSRAVRDAKHSWRHSLDEQGSTGIELCPR